MNIGWAAISAHHLHSPETWASLCFPTACLFQALKSLPPAFLSKPSFLHHFLFSHLSSPGASHPLPAHSNRAATGLSSIT